jgi:hypothetical protein
MNFIVPFGSSILGAVIGGAFLLGGQKYITDQAYSKAKKIVLLEAIRNLQGLIGNVDFIEKGENNIGPTQVTLNIKIDRFYHYEEDLASNRLDDFQKLSELIAQIQSAKDKSEWWKPGSMARDYIKESINTLIALLSLFPNLVKILSSGIPKHQLDKIGITIVLSEAEEQLRKLRSTQKKFTLVPPYEEWGLPLNLEHLGPLY